MAVDKGKSKTAKKDSKTVAKSRTTAVEAKHLKITLVRSVIGRPRNQREVVKGLGLRKINSTVIRKDCPEIRGMVNKIVHLVQVEAIDTK